MQNVNVKNEDGRSMIEMLGVLAIIGVLSVGGIAGYSKAMQKYRINKAIEQITLIAGNVRSFFAPQRSYDGLGRCFNDNDYCKLIKKAKLMPDEMWDDTDKRFENVFGYGVYLYTAHKSSNTDKQAFDINYDIQNDYEICIELLSQDWTAAGATGHYICNGNGCNRRTYLTAPVTMDAAIDACQKAITAAGSHSTLYWLIYFDVNSNCWDASKSSPNTCS